MAETNRWGVVYSSRSGNRKAHKRWNHIRAYMEQKGVQYDFVQSESSDSVYRLANMLCNNGYHTLIIVGGDRAYTIALAPSAPAIALSTAINNLMMVSHFDFVSGFISF